MRAVAVLLLLVACGASAQQLRVGRAVFDPSPSHALGGPNIHTFANYKLVQCAEACAQNPDCASFDFGGAASADGSMGCYLANETRVSKPSLYQFDTSYTYWEKRGPSYYPSGCVFATNTCLWAFDAGTGTDGAWNLGIAEHAVAARADKPAVMVSPWYAKPATPDTAVVSLSVIFGTSLQPEFCSKVVQGWLSVEAVSDTDGSALALNLQSASNPADPFWCTMSAPLDTFFNSTGANAFRLRVSSNVEAGSNHWVAVRSVAFQGLGQNQLLLSCPADLEWHVEPGATTAKVTLPRWTLPFYRYPVIDSPQSDFHYGMTPNTDVFDIGSTPVTWTCSDGSTGQTASCTFNVNVVSATASTSGDTTATTTATATSMATTTSLTSGHDPTTPTPVVDCDMHPTDDPCVPGVPRHVTVQPVENEPDMVLIEWDGPEAKPDAPLEGFWIVWRQLPSTRSHWSDARIPRSYGEFQYAVHLTHLQFGGTYGISVQAYNRNKTGESLPSPEKLVTVWGGHFPPDATTQAPPHTEPWHRSSPSGLSMVTVAVVTIVAAVVLVLSMLATVKCMAARRRRCPYNFAAAEQRLKTLGVPHYEPPEEYTISLHDDDPGYVGGGSSGSVGGWPSRDRTASEAAAVAANLGDMPLQAMGSSTGGGVGGPGGARGPGSATTLTAARASVSDAAGFPARDENGYPFFGSLEHLDAVDHASDSIPSDRTTVGTRSEAGRDVGGDSTDSSESSNSDEEDDDAMLGGEEDVQAAATTAAESESVADTASSDDNVDGEDDDEFDDDADERQGLLGSSKA